MRTARLILLAVLGLEVGVSSAFAQGSGDPFGGRGRGRGSDSGELGGNPFDRGGPVDRGSDRGGTRGSDRGARGGDRGGTRGGPIDRGPDRGGGAPIDRREAIKKKIRALRAYTITEELALDEKTAGKLFPVLAKWDDVTDKLLIERVDLNRQLAGVDAIKDQKAVEKLIDASLANQKAFWDLEDKRLAELRKILTPTQTAKLLTVLPAFERRIQNRLRRAIQNRQAGDDDDDGDDDAPNVDRRRPRVEQRPRRAPRVEPFDRARHREPKRRCDPFDSPSGCD